MFNEYGNPNRLIQIIGEGIDGIIKEHLDHEDISIVELRAIESSLYGYVNGRISDLILRKQAEMRRP